MTLYEGPRFKVMDAWDHYSLWRREEPHGSNLLDELPGPYGILDEEAGGYIAFATDDKDAERIVDALHRALPS